MNWFPTKTDCCATTHEFSFYSLEFCTRTLAGHTKYSPSWNILLVYVYTLYYFSYNEKSFYRPQTTKRRKKRGAKSVHILENITPTFPLDCGWEWVKRKMRKNSLYSFNHTENILWDKNVCVIKWSYNSQNGKIYT